jgi:hypothetical protein
VAGRVSGFQQAERVRAVRVGKRILTKTLMERQIANK